MESEIWSLSCGAAEMAERKSDRGRDRAPSTWYGYDGYEGRGDGSLSCIGSVVLVYEGTSVCDGFAAPGRAAAPGVGRGMVVSVRFSMVHRGVKWTV